MSPLDEAELRSLLREVAAAEVQWGDVDGVTQNLRRDVCKRLREALASSAPSVVTELLRGQWVQLEACCADPDCDRCLGAGLVPVRCSCGALASECEEGEPVCVGCVSRLEPDFP